MMGLLCFFNYEKILILFILIMKNPTAEQVLAEVQKFDPALAAQDEEFCAILGPTGSAKSTLLTYLLGADVSLIKNKTEFNIKYNKPAEQQMVREGKLPQVGDTQESCTTYFTRYQGYQDGKGTTYYDFAGYFDTKGSQMEILNAISHSQVLKAGKKIKLILVLQMETFLERRGGFINDLSNMLSKQFGQDFGTILTSTCLVVSKVNAKDVEKSQISEFAMEMIGQQGTSMQTNLFLNSIFRKNRFGVFPMPNVEIAPYIAQIAAMIEQMPWSCLEHDTAVSLTPNARMAVVQMKHQVQTTIKQYTKALNEFIEQRCSKANIFDASEQMQQVKLLIERNAEAEGEGVKVLGEVLDKLKINEETRKQLLTRQMLFNFCVSIDKSSMSFSVIGLIHSKVKQLIALLGAKISKEASIQEKERMQKKLKQIQEEHQRKLAAQIKNLQLKNKAKLEQYEIQRKRMEEQFMEMEKTMKKKQENMRMLLREKQEQVREQEERQRKKDQEQYRMNNSKNRSFQAPPKRMEANTFGPYGGQVKSEIRPAKNRELLQVQNSARRRRLKQRKKQLIQQIKKMRQLRIRNDY